MSYRVKIESFEGPFQLLLALVSEQKVDIGAVSITEVADQYLAYLDTMRDLDMDVASDFLVVASTLLAIKASALLPHDVVDDFDEEFDSLAPGEARDILITRLIAYKQFKNVAASLHARLDSESRMHARRAGIEEAFVGLLPDYLEGVTLHNLAVVCAEVILQRRVFIHDAKHITAKPIPLDEQIEIVQARLSQNQAMSFADLVVDSEEPIIVIASFLAILELYHRGMIEIEQTEHTGAINLVYLDKEKWEPAPTSGPTNDSMIEYLESKESGG